MSSSAGPQEYRVRREFLEGIPARDARIVTRLAVLLELALKA
jgi:hypothetical protein